MPGDWAPSGRGSVGTADFHIDIKIAKQVVDCKAEKVAVSGVTNTVNFINIAEEGDCMGDALRAQGKDPTKYFFDINSDGSLTFHSDGYPDLKMTSCDGLELASASPKQVRIDT